MKKKIGQANHFIITILIGLNEILTHNTEKPEGFSTSWNPKSKQVSVDRSREYVLNSSLAWSVDALDCYLIECNKSPFIINNETSVLLTTNDKSVASKIDALYEYTLNKLTNLDFQISMAMVRLAILWRNKTTHSLAKNTLDSKYENILVNNSAKINTDFCGLDISTTLSSFSNSKSPTMKEVTAFIRATHIFVEHLDTYFLQNELDLKSYATDTLDAFFTKNDKARCKILTWNSKRQEAKFKTLLLNNGLTEVTSAPLNNSIDNTFYTEYTDHFTAFFKKDKEA